MRHQSEVVRSGFRGPPEVARKAMKDSGPVPSTYSPHWLTPLAGGIRDGAHPRGAPPPPSPGSAAAHSVSRVGPWPTISWSGSRGSFGGFEEVECGGPSGIRTRVSVLRGRVHGS